MPVVKITHRIGSTEEWATANPVLLKGERGIEISDQGYKEKTGDGVTAWNELAYYYSNVIVDEISIAKNADNVLYVVTHSLPAEDLTPEQASLVANLGAVTEGLDDIYAQLSRVAFTANYNDLLNTPELPTDWIVEEGGNSNAWFKVWKSGKIEQGGIVSLYVGATSGGNWTSTVNLPKPVSTINYSPVIVSGAPSGTTVDTKTTTSFRLRYYRSGSSGSSSTYQVTWQLVTS